MNTHLAYLLTWGLTGCILFFLLVILLFRTGLVYTARKPDGTLKEKIPLSGKLTMLIIPASFFAFLALSNYVLLVQQDTQFSFGHLYLLNYALYLILFLFDTLFIDGFMLAIWRPRFLKLPNAMGKESMKRHILISIPIGILIGGILTLISTSTSYYLWI
jgi:hypothetical protein